MSARVYGALRWVMHSGQRRSTSTSWSPCGSQRSGCRNLDPQLGQEDSAMPGESRPMPGRNLAIVVLLAVTLVGCGGDDAPAGIRVRDYTVHSEAVHRDMAVKVVVPGSGERPLLVFLHGRGGNESSYLHDPFLKALKALGSRAPIVAFPDGDDDKYWHDRDSGRWGRYVMREVIPQVARKYGADRQRV